MTGFRISYANNYEKNTTSNSYINCICTVKMFLICRNLENQSICIIGDILFVLFEIELGLFRNLDKCC